MGCEQLSLELKDVSFRYPGEKKRVLDHLDLDIQEGDIYALLGGSGSGKTTALNLTAGFLTAKKGIVRIKGKNVTDEKVHKRNIGIVFQEYALFPHMSVGSNIAYGLRTRNIPSRDVNKRVSDVLELVGLVGYEKRFPSELSGGERQRVALSRALVYKPDLLLLDEPLSALDASLREELRKELRSIIKRSGTTALYVTHDQLEAVSVSDRVGFLKDGRIYEEGVPDQIYWNPRRIETARFMGVSNIFQVSGNIKDHIQTPICNLPMKKEIPHHIGLRPESLKLEGGPIKLDCKVVSMEYRGKDIQIELSTKGQILKASLDGRVKIEKGQAVSMFLSPDEVIHFAYGNRD